MMKLTDEQVAVVGIADWRHLVLAPPGSGKTEMLSQRIIRALEAGVDPARMLCATFTNRAAFEMRARVECAAAGRTLPEVGNLHHFCHRFLMSVGRIDPAKHVLDEVSQLEFVRECLDVLRQELRAGAAADVRKTHGVTVVGMIEGVKSREEPHALRLARLRGMVEDVFAHYDEKDRSPYPDFLSAILIAHQHRLGFMSFETRSYPPSMFELVGEGVIGALVRAYVGLKRKFRAMDFDDLVNDACLYLRKNPLPEENRYLWVQIDEVQDLNPLQWEVVRSLASDAPMLERVRTLFVSQPEYWVRRASFDCFQLMRSADSNVMRIVKLGIGDFIYSEDGELRYRAAHALADLDERRWCEVIKGTSGDWDRMGGVSDPEHEPLIRALLQSKGAEACHRVLRRILARRAL